MELWIRSQDRTILLPINNKLYIPNSKTGEDFGIFYEETMLGHYKKRERALEVLDEIQKYITPTLSLLNDTLNGKQICQVGNILSMVYEMPNE